MGATTPLTEKSLYTKTMKLSIITAVAPDRADFLDETARSIDALREVIDVEWIVVWDGKPTRDVNADVVIHGREGGGISCTRNLGLGYATADYLTSLDADDLIVVEGVQRGLKAFETNPEIGWIGLSRTDIPGRATKHTVSGPQAFAPGELAEHWKAPFMFHPNSFIASTALVRRCGGWPGIATGEDLALVLRMSEEMGGEVLPAVLTRYRVWDKQEVAHSSYASTKKKAFGYIETVINAVRLWHGRSLVHAPSNPGGAFGREVAEEQA